MKYYYVYVKDTLTQAFKTVHVIGSAYCTTGQVFEYAVSLTHGGDAFGLKDFGGKCPADFSAGKIVNGMIGLTKEMK